MKLFKSDDGESIFSRVGSSVLCWRRVDSEWIAERSELPTGAREVAFDAVPDDLREEVMAAAVRAQAIGGGQNALN